MNIIEFSRNYVLSLDKNHPTHGKDHILRVVKNCEMLSKHYECNLNVLIPAAYFHDISLLFGYPKENHAKKSAEIAKEILKEFPEVDQKLIKYAK